MDGRGPDFGGSLGLSQDQPLPPHFSTSSFFFFLFNPPPPKNKCERARRDVFCFLFNRGLRRSHTSPHLGVLRGGGGTREVCVGREGGCGNCGLVSIMFPLDSPCPDFTLPSGALVWAERAPPVFSLLHFESLIDGVIKASPQ